MRTKMKKVKKWLYRGLMSFIIGLMSMTNITLPTKAAGSSITLSGKIPYSYRVTDKDGYSIWAEETEHIYADGEIAFCVQPGQLVTDGSSYSRSEFSRSERNLIEHIAYVGWQLSDKTNEDYLATQFMIWEALGATINSTSYSGYGAKKSAIQNKIDSLFDNYPSFNGTTETIKVGQSITLTDTNGVFSEYSLTSKSDGISVSKSGNSLTISASNEAPENANVKFQLVREDCVGTSMLYSSVSSQDVVLFKVKDPYAMTINLEVQKYGKLRITKTDESNNKVIQRAGVEYDIYNAADNSLVSTIASDENGIAESGLLLFGDYYYIEKKAPEKYLVNANPHYVTIDQAFTTDEFIDSTVTDKQVYGETEITKLDKEYGTRKQGDATLEGAVYGLYAAENIQDPANDGTILYAKDKEVARRTIKNGKANVSNLPLGKYYWKEISAPVGYLIDTKPHVVDLRYQDQNTAKVEVDTESTDQVKKQAFQIEKLTEPGDNGVTYPLSGAQFTYILKSYVKKYGSFEAAVDVANAKDGRILASEWGIMTTDDDGYAKSKALPYGEYIVSETTVPANHFKVDDFTVTVKENSSEPQRLRYFSDPIYKAKLAVVKVDKETGRTIALSNMRFKVKALTRTVDFEAGEYVGYWAWNPLPHYVNEWTTDEDGTVMLEMSLKPGTYQIEEIDSPDGYLLNHEPLKFTLKAGWHAQIGPDNETFVTTVVFKDEPVKGQVQIDKEADLFQGYQSEMTEYGELFTPVYEKGLLAGAKFEIKAKTDIIGMDGTTWYHAGETVETLTSDGENLTTSSLLPIGTEGNNIYSLQEVETAEGYVVDSTVHDFRFDYVDEETDVVAPTWLDENGNAKEDEATITVNNEKQMAVAVASKAMEVGIFDHEDALQNVTFGVFADEVDGLETDSLVGLSKVDDQGQIETGLSQAGSYYLQEVATDDKYVLDDTKYPFTYEYNGDQVQTITVNDGVIENKLKRATLEIIKYTDDEVFYSRVEQAKIAAMGEDKSDLMRDDRNYLAFCEFELATDKAFENIIQTGTTDINGRLVFENLELGTYYVREKDSADFYEINDEVFEITLTKAHQFETIEVKNDLMKSNIDVKKVDAEDHEKTLANAEFTMYADEACQSALATVTTDKDGIAHFENIKFGTTVYVKETKAPIGYQLSDEIVKVTIDEAWVHGDDKTRTIEVTDDLILSYVDIKKVDAEDRNKTLAGAEFTMYADEACQSALATVTTDKDGIARFDNIKFGTTVYVKETKAPTGYELSDEVAKVTIDEEWVHGDEKTRTIEVTDDLILSYVDIKKVNAEDRNKTLAGAEFTMYADEACQSALATITTDKDGIARFDNIKFGTTVYVKETKAPTDYQLSDEIVKVTIDENWVNGDDQTRMIEVVNYHVPAVPNTGSNVNPWMFMGLLGISAAVLVMLNAKRKENE